MEHRRISQQLINPANSATKRMTVTRVIVQPDLEQARHTHDSAEQIWIALRGSNRLLPANGPGEAIRAGLVVRFAEGEVYGFRNDSAQELEYIPVTSPPLNFRGAYRDRVQPPDSPT